ncbi:MAG: hypothetical protein JRE23_13825, partial [Deltaproteobacteria bacterium]|nr:hypothetical protein [Deltaproteobacteria bacterium]
MYKGQKKQKLLVAFLVLSLLASNVNADLAGYWNFDEGTGSIALDKSGNGNDGTLVNG